MEQKPAKNFNTYLQINTKQNYSNELTCIEQTENVQLSKNDTNIIWMSFFLVRPIF